MESWKHTHGNDRNQHVRIYTERRDLADGTLVCEGLPRTKVFALLPVLKQYIEPSTESIHLPGLEEGVDDDALEYIVQTVLEKGDPNGPFEVEEHPRCYINLHAVLILMGLDEPAHQLQHRFWQLFEKFELKLDLVTWLWETFDPMPEWDLRPPVPWPRGRYVAPFADFYLQVMAWQIANLFKLEKLDGEVFNYIFGTGPTSQPRLSQLVQTRCKNFGLDQGYDKNKTGIEGFDGGVVKANNFAALRTSQSWEDVKPAEAEYKAKQFLAAGKWVPQVSPSMTDDEPVLAKYQTSAFPTTTEGSPTERNTADIQQPSRLNLSRSNSGITRQSFATNANMPSKKNDEEETGVSHISEQGTGKKVSFARLQTLDTPMSSVQMPGLVGSSRASESPNTGDPTMTDATGSIFGSPQPVLQTPPIFGNSMSSTKFMSPPAGMHGGQSTQSSAATSTPENLTETFGAAPIESQNCFIFKGVASNSTSSPRPQHSTFGGTYSTPVIPPFSSGVSDPSTTAAPNVGFTFGAQTPIQNNPFAQQAPKTASANWQFGQEAHTPFNGSNAQSQPMQNPSSFAFGATNDATSSNPFNIPNSFGTIPGVSHTVFNPNAGLDPNAGNPFIMHVNDDSRARRATAAQLAGRKLAQPKRRR